MMEEQACLLTFLTARARGTCTDAYYVFTEWRNVQQKTNKGTKVTFWSCSISNVTDVNSCGAKTSHICNTATICSKREEQKSRNDWTDLREDLWQEVCLVYNKRKERRNIGQDAGQKEGVFGFIVEHSLKELHALINGQPLHRHTMESPH